MTTYVGTAGHDNLVGDGTQSLFDISQGGRDTVMGGGADDTIKAGAAFDSKDRIDGADRFDLLELDGDYSAGVSITDSNLVGVEQLKVIGGHDYDLTVLGLSPNWDQGEYFYVHGTALQAGDQLTVDASAIADTPIYFYSGAGDDTFIGGGLVDRFSLAMSGVDHAAGGGGDDIFELGLPLDPGPGAAQGSVDGGAGDDTLYLRTGSLEGLELQGGSGADVLVLEGEPQKPVILDSRVAGFESIEAGSGFAGSIRAADSLVAAGGSIVVRGVYESALRFDGGHETDGRFEMHGGGGSDVLRGGALDDLFTESWGPDTVMGGGGDDRILVDNYQIDALSRYDGGKGHDVLEVTDSHMSGDPFHFGAFTFRNVETLEVGGIRQLVLHDGNLAHGKVLDVVATTVWGGRVDGSAETDGRFHFHGGESYDDPIGAPSGTDLFIGGASRDTLSGGAFGDTLIGGGGSDKLIGGSLDDLLTGGGGVDVFTFQSISDVDSNVWDLITDLTKTDVIDLRGIDANELKDGNQAFTVVSAFTHKAGELTLTFDADANRTTLLLDVDGDALADGTIQMVGDWDRFGNFVL